MKAEKEYTDDEIKAMLSLIKKAKLDKEYPANAASIEKKRDFVLSIVTEFGEPHELTEEDEKNNPELFAAVPDGEPCKVGDIVFIPAISEESSDETDPADTTDAVTGTTEPTEPTSPEASSKQPAAQEASTPTRPKIQVFKGKQVLGTENQVINGRLHVKITTSGETYVVTFEEFTNEVTEA